MHKSKLRLIIAAIAALLAELVYPAFNGAAHAAATQFDVTVVRWDTHKALTDTGVLVCVKPNADVVVPINSDTTPYHMEVVFPHLGSGTDFTFNSTTPADWAIDTNLTNEGPIVWNGTTYTPQGGTPNMLAFPNMLPAGTPHADTVTAPVSHTAGGIVDFPFGSAAGFTLAALNLYCFHITATNTLHNSDIGTAPTLVEGAVNMYDNAGTPNLLYQSLYNTSIIADDTVVVNAIVPPNFTMTLSGTPLSFGRLSTLAINTTSSGAVLDIVTNAPGGWIAWVKDTDRGGAGLQGLHSTTANYTIKSGGEGGAGTGLLDGTPELLKTAGGQEGYLLDADFTDAASGCTGQDDTVAPAHGAADGANADYDADETTINAGVDTYSGGTLDRNFQPLANCTGAPPATANHDQVTMHGVATISGATPAGTDYSDTWTVVAAGEF